MRELKEILGEDEYEIFIQKGYLNPIYWIENVSGYKLTWFAKEWIQAILRKRKINLIAFRGSAKSEIAIWFTLWYVWYHNKKEILITSHNRDHSWKMMERIKEKINDNELLKELRPEDREIVWNKDYMTTTTGCHIYTRAYKPSIAGLRTDLIIVDETSKCNDDASFSIFHRIIEGTGHMNDAIEICLTTPEGPVDLCYELKNNPDWVTFEVPIVNKFGEPNWPEKYPKDKIEKIRRGSEHAFQQEYMLNANAPVENALYPTNLLVATFDTTMRFTSQKLSQNEDKGYRVLAADFAVADGPRADFDAYCVMEKLDSKIYLKHGERHKGFPKNAKVTRLIEIYKQFDCNAVILDPNGIGDAVMRDLRAEGYQVIGQEFHSAARNKLLMALRVAFDEGNVIFPRNPEDPAALTYTNVLVNELLGFKETKVSNITHYQSTSSHDDTAMALAMGVVACASQRPFIDCVGI